MRKAKNIQRRAERRNKRIRNTYQRRGNINPSDFEMMEESDGASGYQRAWLANVVEINKAKARIGYKINRKLPTVPVYSLDTLIAYTTPVKCAEQCYIIPIQKLKAR